MASAQGETATPAAQLATKSAKPSSGSREIEALGPDGKLSAAGAATSLKYANAKDLPSYPSVGIDTSTSGNKAANLANSSQKPIELWRPDPSSSASKAALLASRDGGKLDLWQYSPDGTGNTAATAAMGKNSSPQLDYGYTEDGRKRALLAATMSLTPRERPTSTDSAPPPELYPDQSNAGFNALNAAAAVAGRPAARMSAIDAARVQNTQGVSREMYTERPPVALEVEEKKRREALRASAISMANQLYNLEKADVERSIQTPGSVAADRMAAQSYEASTTHLEGDAIRVQAMNYAKVQEEAQRLAAERLAKLDPDGVLAYREHYGYGHTAQKSRFSFGSSRGRSTDQTNRDQDADDEAQAAKIKSQMSRFNDQVATVDAKKRSQDRENLMAAAQRKVQAQMQTMDEKLFAETGKIPPSMMEDWQAKAKAKATADSEQRMENHGKVHIGAGKFMDQSEVDAIAAARMQPTLDEINEEAERRRAHEEAVRQDLERHKERVEAEKQKEREVKAEQKRIQDEESEKRRQEKAVEKEKARVEKEKEKERLKNEKMQQDLEKRMAKMEQKQIKEQQKAEKALKAEQQKIEDARVRKEAEEKAQASKLAAAAPDVQTSVPETTEEEAVHTSGLTMREDHMKTLASETTEEEPAHTSGLTMREDYLKTSVPETKEDDALPETEATAEVTTAETTTVEATTAEVTTADATTAEAATAPETSDTTREIPSAIVVPASEDVSTSAAQDEPVSPTTVIPPGEDEQVSPTTAAAETTTAATPTAAIATAETAAAPPTTTETTTTPRRDSRVKSFFGKIKRFSKNVPATTSDKEAEGKAATETTEAEEKDATETTESTALSENAKGKLPASVSDVSSIDEEGDSRGRNVTDTSTADVFEEARDTFDSEPEAPRASYSKDPVTGSPTRGASKFQEEL